MSVQGDLSRKEWVAPALSPLTEGAGGAGTTGSGTGIRQTLNNAVEATKDYLPPQVSCGSFLGICILKNLVTFANNWSQVSAQIALH